MNPYIVQDEGFRKRGIKFILCWLSVFAVSMGFLEAIVVVYLRMLFFPEGFSFPLGELPPGFILIEIGREACTILMLVSVAAVSGGNRMRRFGAFLYIFGVWDVFYYVALKLILGWPQSVLAWDILFLIPVAWTGPVLAPVIVALTLSAFGSWLLTTGSPVRLPRVSWALMSSGALFVLCAFLWDYAEMVIGGGFLGEFFTLFANEEFMRIASSHVPVSFHWGVFTAGEVITASGMVWAVWNTAAGKGA